MRVPELPSESQGFGLAVAGTCMIAWLREDTGLRGIGRYRRRSVPICEASLRQQHFPTAIASRIESRWAATGVALWTKG